MYFHKFKTSHNLKKFVYWFRKLIVFLHICMFLVSMTNLYLFIYSWDFPDCDFYHFFRRLQATLAQLKQEKLMMPPNLWKHTVDQNQQSWLIREQQMVSSTTSWNPRTLQQQLTRLGIHASWGCSLCLTTPTTWFPLPRWPSRKGSWSQPKLLEIAKTWNSS